MAYKLKYIVVHFLIYTISVLFLAKMLPFVLMEVAAESGLGIESVARANIVCIVDMFVTIFLLFRSTEIAVYFAGRKSDLPDYSEMKKMLIVYFTFLIIFEIAGKFFLENSVIFHRLIYQTHIYGYKIGVFTRVTMIANLVEGVICAVFMAYMVPYTLKIYD